jgi:hypothetical protein
VRQCISNTPCPNSSHVVTPAFHSYEVFAINKGLYKAPSREFFRMHAWFMLALPAWRATAAAAAATHMRGALPAIAVAIHFGCYANNCRWPFLRHPHDFEAGDGAAGYFSPLGTALRSLATSLPQNDVSVVAPYFLFYAAVPALLPVGFPAVLPRLATRVGRGASRRLAKRHGSAPPSQAYAGANAPGARDRAAWVAVLATCMVICAVSAHSAAGGSAHPSRHLGGQSGGTSSAPKSSSPAGSWLERALFHSKRAYGCTATVFPPRRLTVRTDEAHPCGGSSAGGWSAAAALLDAAGVLFGAVAVTSLGAAAPRATGAWSTVGGHTLSVYLSHVYILPALDMPLAALVQAAADIHPELAAPVALAASLAIVRALAAPLPLASLLSIGCRLAGGVRAALRCALEVRGGRWCPRAWGRLPAWPSTGQAHEMEEERQRLIHGNHPL